MLPVIGVSSLRFEIPYKQDNNELCMLFGLVLTLWACTEKYNLERKIKRERRTFLNSLLTKKSDQEKRVEMRKAGKLKKAALRETLLLPTLMEKVAELIDLEQSSGDEVQLATQGKSNSCEAEAISVGETIHSI